MMLFSQMLVNHFLSKMVFFSQNIENFGNFYGFLWWHYNDCFNRSVYVVNENLGIIFGCFYDDF